MHCRKSLVAAVLCGCFILPALVGCEAGDQQVRDEVLDLETTEGENLQIRDGEIEDDVNIDVKNNE